MNELNILIIGAGYIGSEAAYHWTAKHHHVTITTENPNRLEKLSKCSQKCVLLDGANEESLAPLIAQNTVLLVTDTADSVNDYGGTHLRLAHTVKQIAIKQASPRYLIYTSSTAVYGDHSGLWVNEQSELKAKDEKSKILIEVESLFQSLADVGWRVCILRLAEIYGPGRELSKRTRFSKERSTHESPHHFTNMVHRADVIGALDFSLKHKLVGLFNLADDEHAAKKDFHTEFLNNQGVSTIPEKGNIPHVTANKRVSNTRIKAEGFKLIHPKRALH